MYTVQWLSRLHEGTTAKYRISSRCKVWKRRVWTDFIFGLEVSLDWRCGPRHYETTGYFSAQTGFPIHLSPYLAKPWDIIFVKYDKISASTSPVATTCYSISSGACAGRGRLSLCGVLPPGPPAGGPSGQPRFDRQLQLPPAKHLKSSNSLNDDFSYEISWQ